MAFLPQIGNGALVGPEQVLLLHKPTKRTKQDHTFVNGSDHVNKDESSSKKQKEPGKDWFTESAEKKKKVRKKKTPRRQEAGAGRVPEDVNNNDRCIANGGIHVKRETDGKSDGALPNEKVQHNLNGNLKTKQEHVPVTQSFNLNSRRGHENTPDNSNPVTETGAPIQNGQAGNNEVPGSQTQDSKIKSPVQTEIANENGLPVIKQRAKRAKSPVHNGDINREHVSDKSKRRIKSPVQSGNLNKVSVSDKRTQGTKPLVQNGDPNRLPVSDKLLRKPRPPRQIPPLKPSNDVNINKVNSPRQNASENLNGNTESDKRVRFEDKHVNSEHKLFKLTPVSRTEAHIKAVKTSGQTVSKQSEPVTKSLPAVQFTSKRSYKFSHKPGINTERSKKSDNIDENPAPKKSLQARVREAREKAKLWAETNSDPGPAGTNATTLTSTADTRTSKKDISIKAIHNDSVLKGRPTEPRRGRTFNELPRPKQAQDPSHGQKGQERAKRLQPPKKESHGPDSEPRSATAPAKEQPLMNGPVPKVNTLVPKNEEKPSPRKEKAPPHKQETIPVPKETVKPSPRQEKPKPVVEKQTAEIPVKPSHVIEKAKPKTEVPAKKYDTEDEHEEVKRDFKPPKLPPDDHGPVNPPRHKSPPPNNTEVDNDFKYHASEKQKEEDDNKAPTPKVPPIELHPEKSKVDKNATNLNTSKSKSNDAKFRTSSISPRRSKTTVDISKSPRTEFGEPGKKRREVTIVDPKNLPNKESEAYLDEFVYGNNDRHKEFEDMDDEEKAEYFRNTLKMKPEQIRELTFHPKVNEPKVIHNTYTGMDTVNWAPNSARAKSGKRPKSIATKVYKKVQTIEPYKRKSFMLSRLQGVIYKHINKVYGNTPKNNREKQFFQKLAHVQMEEYRKRYNRLEVQERKWLESTYRQRQQLSHVRKKFEDDAWRRFMTQYVTSKVLEAEYKDRQEYGLPNHVTEIQNKPPVKRMPVTLTPNRRSRVNQKKFGNMFTVNVPTLSRKEENLRFEGIDTVYVDTEDDQGKTTKRRKNVEDIMKEAQRILNQSDESDIEDSPPPPPVRKARRPARYTHSERRAGSEKLARPSVHRSRDWRQSSERGSTPSHRSKSRSKSRNRSKPKNMKDLMDKRKKESTQVRYKASNFESMKKDLLKDSALLDKTVKGKVPAKKKQTHDNVIDTVAQSNTAPDTQTNSSDKRPDNHITSSNHEPPNTTVTTTTTETTTTTTTNTSAAPNGTNDGKVSKASYAASKGQADYLDHMETQMGLDTARELKDVKSIESKSPTKSDGNKSVTKASSRKAGSETGSVRAPLSEVGSAKSPHQRVASRISVQSKRTPVLSGQKQQQDVNSGARISRAPSEARMSRAPSESRMSRAPSRLSIQSKQTKDMNGDIHVPMAPSITSRAPSRASQQSVYDQFENKTAIKRNSVISQQSSVTKPIPTGRLSRASIAKPPVDDNKQQGNTGRLSRASVKINPRGSVTSVNNKAEDKNVVVNGHDTQGKPDEETVSPTLSKDKHVSPMLNGYSRSPSLQNKKYGSPTVKTSKSVHMDEVVNEVIINARKEGNSPTKIVKSTQEGRPKASKPRVIRARSPTGVQSRTNGHGDMKIDREDYERAAKNRPTRARRRSGSRGRSTSRSRKRSASRSRDRKRSISRDRKKATQGRRKSQVVKTRFPEIDKSGRMSSLSNKDGRASRSSSGSGGGGVSKKTKRTVTVKEKVTEREKTPEPKQWRDLVQRYLRQPSPKVGKTEDRSLLDAPLETDDDDDDIDIFERAKKRYLLDSDEDSM